MTSTPHDAFAPAALGPVRLRNRTVKAATFEGRTPGGIPVYNVAFHLPKPGGRPYHVIEV